MPPQDLVGPTIIDESAEAAWSGAMLQMLLAVLSALLSSLKSRREFAVENLALRQQPAVANRSIKRPNLTKADRTFWVALSRWWTSWRDALVIVKPETAIAWHRTGFKLFRRACKCGGKLCRRGLELC